MIPNIFPRKDGDFNTYFLQVILHLFATNTPDPVMGGIPVHTLQLGLTADKLNPLWAMFNSWADLYPKSKDSTQRTKTITGDKNAKRKQIEAKLRELYNDIPESALTSTDRDKLNLKLRDTTLTRRGKINDTVTIELKSDAGSRVKVRCRLSEDATRASMHPLADGIEMKYKIGAAPATPEQCTNSMVSKKALFSMEAGMENAGQRLYAFFRYVNLTNPENNGPWGVLHNVIIQG
jgi:hypothetical protein